MHDPAQLEVAAVVLAGAAVVLAAAAVVLGAAEDEEDEEEDEEEVEVEGLGRVTTQHKMSAGPGQVMLRSTEWPYMPQVGLSMQIPAEPELEVQATGTQHTFDPEQIPVWAVPVSLPQEVEGVHSPVEPLTVQVGGVQHSTLVPVQIPEVLVPPMVPQAPVVWQVPVTPLAVQAVPTPVAPQMVVASMYQL